MHRDGRTALPSFLKQTALTMATLLSVAVGASSASAQTPAQTAEMTPATQFSTQPASMNTTGGGGALLLALMDAHKGAEVSFYSSPLGNMLTGLRKPLSFMTGGLIRPTSPKAAAQLAANGAANGAANSPSGSAAAKIKANQAAAKARQANVRYLGTVDCHWYPEAEAALIASLRADSSECVRHEAALSLGRGCCCTKKTVEALKISITGSNRDGNPSETSLRVKLAAFEALQNCLANCASGKLDASTPPAGRPEYPPEPLAPQATTTGDDVTAEAQPDPTLDYYRAAEAKPWSSVIGEAQQIVTRLNSSRREVSLNGYGTGRHNLYNLWVQSSVAPQSLAPSLAPSPTPAYEQYDATSIASRPEGYPSFNRSGGFTPPPGQPTSPNYSEDTTNFRPGGSNYSAPTLQRTPPIESDTRRVDYQQPTGEQPTDTPVYNRSFYAPP